MYQLLLDLLDAGMTILLVEQDVSQAVRVASRVQCLLEGRTTLEGRPAAFTPAQIEAAYFGPTPQAPEASRAREDRSAPHHPSRE